MVPPTMNLTWRLTSALLLVVAGAFSQSLPTVKDWAGMASSERLVWANLKASWNVESLSPEMRSEVEQLNKAALAAVASGDHAASVKHLSHAITIMRGQEWTPQRAFAAAFTADLDRAVAGPGDVVKIHLGQSFPLDEKLKGAMKITASLQEAATAGSRARETELKSLNVADVDWSRAPLDVEVQAPNTPCPNCRIAIALSEPPIRRVLPIRIQPGLAELTKRIAAANERVAALEAKGQADVLAALAPIQYRLSLVEPGAFNEADAALGALEGGGNPWANRHGDFRMAYRSAVDRTLQPYRLFVPVGYDGSKPFPLIVALHGAGRDENFYFDSVQDGQFKTFAERRGYIVACPRGRDPVSMYVGDGEQDVLDVLADVRRTFKVDPARIYLAGHAMGGAAVWSIAMDHPDLFAALAATAPAVFFLTVDDMAKLKSLPQIVVQGDQDAQVSVKQTRLFTEAARKAGAQVKYLEMSGAGHMDVVAPALSEMFDWFDGHRKAGALAP
jgi:pimeloyl-ACP methyl ester carboxylesterase